MKNFYPVLAFILYASLSAAQNIKPLAQKVHEIKTQAQVFEPVRMFNSADAISIKSIPQNSDSKDASILEIREQAIRDILTARPENILFTIPSANGNVTELELFRVQLFTPDFNVVTASGRMFIPGGIHYRGIVKGDNASLAAVSIFDNEIMGIISSPSAGNLVLGKLKNDPAERHVFYSDKDLPAAPLQCFTTDDHQTYSLKHLQLPGKLSSVNCIRIYWEVNYDIFLDKGNIVNATNYVTGLFNERGYLLYPDYCIPI